MMCPRCASAKTAVIKTNKGLKNLRWRKCIQCKYSWMTEEKPIKDGGLLEYIEYMEEIGEYKENEK